MKWLNMNVTYYKIRMQILLKLNENYNSTFNDANFKYVYFLTKYD